MGISFWGNNLQKALFLSSRLDFYANFEIHGLYKDAFTEYVLEKYKQAKLYRGIKLNDCC